MSLRSTLRDQFVQIDTTFCSPSSDIVLSNVTGQVFCIDLYLQFTYSFIQYLGELTLWVTQSLSILLGGLDYLSRSEVRINPTHSLVLFPISKHRFRADY